MKTYSELIEDWVFRELDSDGKSWLSSELNKISTNQYCQNDFDIIFGLIPRKLGKFDLKLSKIDLKNASEIKKGWVPYHWSIDIACRVLLLSKINENTNPIFIDKYKDLHKYADGRELLALYSGLCLYNYHIDLLNISSNGLRTNIKSEFEAIAHNNSFPFDHFSLNTWNNMVLKALFIGARLNPIYGLDQRANLELANILQDYAHERWAANRDVSPELWRCVGPFINDLFFKDFKKVIDNGSEIEKKAIALSIYNSPNSSSKSNLLKELTVYVEDIKNNKLNWNEIENKLNTKS